MGLVSVDRNSNTKTIENSELFRRYSEDVAELGRSIGVRIVPYRDPKLPFFSKLSPEKQEKALENLRIYLKVCRSVIASNGDLKDPVVMTWNAVKEMKMRPSSDLFSYIQPHNVIEFHDSEGIQIFRNFAFYDCCSYSLEELYSFSWDHLYKRDMRVFERLMGFLREFYTGQNKKTVRTDFGSHIIEEVYSPFKYQIEAEMVYLSPLFDAHNRVCASISIELGNVLGEPLSPEEEEALLLKYLERVDNHVFS